MIKHTLKENILSVIIGAGLAIPIGLFGINNPTQAKPINLTTEYEVVDIKDGIIPIVATPKKSDKKSLGKFRVTAYCHCIKCCGKDDGITATGTKVKEGRTIAVDPKVIPLGSKVELDGKTYVAEDVGGAIKGNRIDLYFSSHDEANQWGVKYKKAYLIGGR
jgi:3D (Asp-Asp-Asp) domain-containing protein